MLYDPKWGKQTETKADPFTLESLLAWLEKQPADKSYCYTSNGRCLLAQYFSAVLGTGISMGSREFSRLDDPHLNEIELPAGFGDIAWEHPRTFGAATERTRAALSSTIRQD